MEAQEWDACNIWDSCCLSLSLSLTKCVRFVEFQCRKEGKVTKSP